MSTGDGLSAGERWAALDFDATDTPSVDQTGAINFRWPEPGEACLCEDATAQLYWPATSP